MDVQYPAKWVAMEFILRLVKDRVGAHLWRPRPHFTRNIRKPTDDRGNTGIERGPSAARNHPRLGEREAPGEGTSATTR